MNIRFNDDKSYDRFLKKGRSPMRSGTVAMALVARGFNHLRIDEINASPCDMELDARFPSCELAYPM